MLRSTGSHLAQLLSQSAAGQLQLASCWRQLSSKAKGTTLAYEEMTTQAVTQARQQHILTAPRSSAGLLPAGQSQATSTCRQLPSFIWRRWSC